MATYVWAARQHGAWIVAWEAEQTAKVAAAAAVVVAAAAAAAAVAAATAAEDDGDGGGGAGGANLSLAAVAAGHPLVSLAVHVAPAGLLAFAKGSLCVASAGLPVAEFQTQMAQKKAAASVPKANAR